MPPWSRSSSTFAMLRRLFHCSRRRPATHASSVASLRLSGSTLRTSQHADAEVDALVHQVRAVGLHEPLDVGPLGELELDVDPVLLSDLLEQRVRLRRAGARCRA